MDSSDLPETTEHPSTHELASGKFRLDQALVTLGLCSSRSQAQGFIMAGQVFVNDQPVTKAGYSVTLPKDHVRLAQQQRFVSRGGFKLEQALDVFGLDVTGRIALDVGASTGGFTDCLLQRGARQVIAVDVGYGQLDWSLRQDERVVVIERQNIRTFQIPDGVEAPSVAVADVSFISLVKVIPHMASLLNANAPSRLMVTLLKPQFEFKDCLPGKPFKGIVRDPNQHREIIEKTLSRIEALLPEWQASGLTFSPITGPKGNMEFLVHWEPKGLSAEGKPAVSSQDIDRIVKQAHQAILANDPDS